MIFKNQSFFSLPHIKQTMFFGIAALGATSIAISGCDQISDNEEIRSGKTNVTAEEVATTTEDSMIVGKTVTIRNQVKETVGDSSFLMAAEAGSPILVVNATGQPFVPSDQNIPIQATGTVESFIVADVNQKYGLDLDPALYVDYERQPAIIAQSLALAPQPEDLAEAPAGYFDKTIAVEGEFRQLTDGAAQSNGFALFEEGWVDDVGVLVLGENLQNEAIQDGEIIVVTGKARQPDASLLQTNLGWDANRAQDFLSNYKNRPVIIADNVYPSAVSTQ